MFDNNQKKVNKIIKYFYFLFFALLTFIYLPKVQASNQTENFDSYSVSTSLSSVGDWDTSYYPWIVTDVHRYTSPNSMTPNSSDPGQTFNSFYKMNTTGTIEAFSFFFYQTQAVTNIQGVSIYGESFRFHNGQFYDYDGVIEPINYFYNTWYQVVVLYDTINNKLKVTLGNNMTVWQSFPGTGNGNFVFSAKGDSRDKFFIDDVAYLSEYNLTYSFDQTQNTVYNTSETQLSGYCPYNGVNQLALTNCYYFESNTLSDYNISCVDNHWQATTTLSTIFHKKCLLNVNYLTDPVHNQPIDYFYQYYPKNNSYNLSISYPTCENNICDNLKLTDTGYFNFRVNYTVPTSTQTYFAYYSECDSWNISDCHHNGYGLISDLDPTNNGYIDFTLYSDLTLTPQILRLLDSSGTVQYFMQFQNRSSTSSSAQLDTISTSGVCNLLCQFWRYLTVPKIDTLASFKGLSTLISSKSPFGYITDLSKDFSSLTLTTSTLSFTFPLKFTHNTYNIKIFDSESPFVSFLQSYLFPLQDVAMWFLLVIYVVNRLKKLEY